MEWKYIDDFFLYYYAHPNHIIYEGDYNIVYHYSISCHGQIQFQMGQVCIVSNLT